MKVLFLDVDGVLNSLRSCEALGGYGFISQHDSWKQLDPVAVGLLRRIVQETGCKVVLSSSWRILATPDDIIAFEKFLGAEIVGETPQTSEGHRGKEIQKWLDDNLVYTYCIVDDDSDMLDSQKPFFVKTDFNLGMSFQNYEQIVEILGESNE